MLLMNYSISVVIPMYNASQTIERALRSVENQINFEFKEVIIIDDGSSDNSYEIVAGYKGKSKLNIIIFKQKNQGVSSARNFGIEHASGNYVAFLDSDDEWLPEKTKEQMNLFKIPGVVMVGGNHFNRSREGMGAFAFIDYKKQLFKNYFQTSTVIVARDVLNVFGGFYVEQKYAEEGRFYFELLNHGKAILLNKPVVIYDGGNKAGFGHSGLSKNIIEMQRGEIANIKFAYKKNNASIYLVALAYCYSWLKFVRRSIMFIIMELRK
ncbi:glycosyltransferase family 2 protein [Aeromonas veronii]